MRYLLVNQFYPPDLAPTGRYLHDLARALVAAGHSVTVVCSRAAYGGGGRYPAREVRDGVSVRRVPALSLGRESTAGRLSGYVLFLPLALAALLRPPRPDLILALTTPPYLGFVAKIAARLRGVGHAHWVMDVYPDALVAHSWLRTGSLFTRLLERLARFQFGGARRVVGLGPFMVERLRAYCRPDTTLESLALWAPEHVGASDGARLRAERGWAPGDLVLMYAGNMGLGHRFGEFLEAAARLGPNGPVWAFVGGGARRVEVEAARGTQPAARIQLLPYVADDRLPESLASADVHLASLSRDWQGVIVPSKIQAIFAAGRPVLFVGPRENEIASWIEQSGAGWIVPEGDVDALLGVVAAARDPAERARRGQAAQAFATEHFSLEGNGRRLVELLVLSAQGAPSPPQRR